MSVRTAAAAPTAPRPEAEAPPRARALAQDVVALAALACVMAPVTRAVAELVALNPGGFGRLDRLGAAACGVGLVVLALLAVAVDRRHRLSALPRSAVGLVTRPSADVLLLAVGSLVAAPVTSLAAPVLAGDADSARLVAGVQHVRLHGPEYLVATQDSLLPHAIYGPLLDLGGIPAARAYAAASTTLLIGVVCWLTFKTTRSGLAAVFSGVAVACLPAVMERSFRLPLYPTMLALGYIGCYLAYVAMSRPGRGRWAAAVGAGICLVASTEAHSVGQLFVAVPLLQWAIVHRDRRGAAGLAQIYLAVAVVGLPRVLINYSQGGLAHLRTSRSDYWVTKGYLEQIQAEFWDKPVRLPIAQYVDGLPRTLLFQVLDQPGFVALGLVVVGFVLARGRLRWLGLACLGMLFAAAVVKRVPIYDRYFSPVMPGLAMAAGAALALLWRRGWLARVLAVAAMAGLLVSAATTFTSTAREEAKRTAQVESRPFRRIVAEIDDGKGVIGARASKLVFVDADVRTFGGQFLPERDFVTYLTWPSDEAVVRMLRRHDIGWVLVMRTRDLEVDYHDTWVRPAHGRPVRHPPRLAASPRFCTQIKTSRFRLYRLGPCER